MPIFAGNTTGSVTQVAANLPSGVMSFSLVNKSGGAITVNLSISGVSILPNNLSLDAGDTVYSDSTIKILKGASLHLIVTGSTDYYFSISPIE